MLSFPRPSVLATLAALAACRSFTPPPQPAPAPSSEQVPAIAVVADSGIPAPRHRASGDTKPDSARHGYTAADVRFVQGMIAHHGQALAMTALVPARAAREDVKLLAQRIDASQQSEITTMQQWLRSRGESVPSPDGHAMHAAMGHDMPAMSHDASAPMLMPGMLTPEEMTRLAAASGAAFDRLFLASMIRHHEGAIRMVGDLLAAPGSGQEPQLFDMANGIEADQRAEIDRMQRMLRGM